MKKSKKSTIEKRKIQKKISYKGDDFFSYDACWSKALRTIYMVNDYTVVN